MDLPVDHATGMAVPVLPTATIRRTRRPSGEPPALPRHVRISGVGWLLAAAVLVASALAIFSRGLRGVAAEVTVADDAVVRWLEDLHVPGLAGTFRALATLDSWPVLDTVPLVLLVALIALRRFRHAIIWLLAITLLQVVAGNLLARSAQRPRPLGVDVRTDW
jgi:hypothetical protein